MAWYPMNKGVTNLGSDQGHCRAANERYLNALPVVAEPSPTYAGVSHVTEPKAHQERRYAGLKPARGEDVKLFAAVLKGEHELHGFRNADTRQQLLSGAKPKADQRRRSNAISRLLKRLRVRGLIAKTPRSRRWRVTSRGHATLGAIIQLHYHGLLQAS